MSHSQMKKRGKVSNFRTKKIMFWHILVTCIEFALSFYGKLIGNFLSTTSLGGPIQVRTKTRCQTTIFQKFQVKTSNTR